MNGTERKIVFWYDDDAAYAEEVDLTTLVLDPKVIRRQAIPRHFEKGWEDKLAVKYQVLSMTRELSLNAETKKVIPSKADLKMGCRRMESLAKSYWKAKGYDM